MWTRLLLISCLLVGGLNLSAQDVAISLKPDGGTGWWVYRLGFDAEGSNIGYAESHLSLTAGFNIDVSSRFDRWCVGLNGGMMLLDDDEMRRTNYSFGQSRSYIIAEKNVKFAMAGVSLGYILVDRPRYRFIPGLQLGLFSENSTHPDKAAFATRSYYTISALHEIGKGNIRLQIGPYYRALQIATSPAAPLRSKHVIYSIGLQLGISWLL